MKRIKIISNVFSLAAISIVIWAFGGSLLLAGEMNQTETVKLAPGWELADLDGKTVHSADFKGRVVVLDFWATWCPPCRAGIPDFIELQKKYAARGLTVIGVSVDQAGLKTVKSFAEKKQHQLSRRACRRQSCGCLRGH